MSIFWTGNVNKNGQEIQELGTGNIGAYGGAQQASGLGRWQEMTEKQDRQGGKTWYRQESWVRHWNWDWLDQ